MKKLKINAATCDVHKVTEETLSAYDKVEIHTACIVTSPAAQALMGRYAVRVNAAGNLMLDGDVRITTINGPMSIHPGQAVPEEKVYLQVNGPWTSPTAVRRSCAAMRACRSTAPSPVPRA